MFRILSHFGEAGFLAEVGRAEHIGQAIGALTSVAPLGLTLGCPVKKQKVRARMASALSVLL